MSHHTTAVACPLQANHIRNLIYVLRRANAHYTCVAARIRSAYRPSLHARKRAQKLGLTINVSKAVACPQKQVSNIPLPILEVNTPQAPHIVTPVIDASATITYTSHIGDSTMFSPMPATSSPITYPSYWSAFDEDELPYDSKSMIDSQVYTSPSLSPVNQGENWETVSELLDDVDLESGLKYPHSASGMDSDNEGLTDWDSGLQYCCRTGSSSVLASTPFSALYHAVEFALATFSESSFSGKSSPSLLIRVKRKPAGEESGHNDRNEKRSRISHNCTMRRAECGHVICISPRR